MWLRFRKVLPTPTPPVGSGYRVAAARGRADPNAAGWAGGAWAAEELRGARPAGSPAAHLERSGRTWAGRGAGAQARDPASPLPTSPAGAHLGDSQRKRSLGRRFAWQRGRPGGQAGSGGGGGVEPNGPRESQPPESPVPPPALGSRPAGSAPGRPPLPAACPAHLPGKPARSRRGPRDPGEGQAAGRSPRSCPRPVGPGLESGFQLPPLRELERPAGTRVTPVSDAPRQPRGQSSSPSALPGLKVPLTPGLVLGKADLRRRRCARLANLG